MERIMTFETLRSFTYVNDSICAKPIRGIVIAFFGLGSQTRHAVDPVEGEIFGEKGILYVYPYNNPWHWMNRQGVAFTDEIGKLQLVCDLAGEERIGQRAEGVGGECAYGHFLRRGKLITDQRALQRRGKRTACIHK